MICSSGIRYILSLLYICLQLLISFFHKSSFLIINKFTYRKALSLFFIHTLFTITGKERWYHYAPIPYNESDVDLLARLMRAEAEGEGRQGEQLVGCVVVNRVLCDCLDFKTTPYRT